MPIEGTGDEAFKSICRVLGPLTKKPTLGVQHAVEAGYLFKLRPHTTDC